MDEILRNLFGGQEDEDHERRRARDFVNRYEQGSPAEGYSYEEVLQN